MPEEQKLARISSAMSPDFMADNCLAALQACGLATCDGLPTNNGDKRRRVDLNDQQVLRFCLNTFLFELDVPCMATVTMWASVSKAWRFHVLARREGIMARVRTEVEVRPKNRKRKAVVEN